MLRSLPKGINMYVLILPYSVKSQHGLVMAIVLDAEAKRVQKCSYIGLGW